MPGQVVRLKSRPSVSMLANAFMAKGREPRKSRQRLPSRYEQFQQVQQFEHCATCSQDQFETYSHELVHQNPVPPPPPHQFIHQKVHKHSPQEMGESAESVAESRTSQTTPQDSQTSQSPESSTEDASHGESHLTELSTNGTNLEETKTEKQTENVTKQAIQNLVAHQTKLMMFWEQKLKSQWEESNAIRSELEHLKKERESDRALIAILNGKIEKLTNGLNAMIGLQRKDSTETRAKFRKLEEQQERDRVFINNMTSGQCSSGQCSGVTNPKSIINGFPRNEPKSVTKSVPKNELKNEHNQHIETRFAAQQEEELLSGHQEDERALVASLGESDADVTEECGLQRDQDTESSVCSVSLSASAVLVKQKEVSQGMEMKKSRSKALKVKEHSFQNEHITENIDSRLESQKRRKQQEEERALVASLSHKMEKMTAELTQLSRVSVLPNNHESWDNKKWSDVLANGPTKGKKSVGSYTQTATEDEAHEVADVQSFGHKEIDIKNPKQSPTSFTMETDNTPSDMDTNSWIFRVVRSVDPSQNTYHHK